jgi:hypothetical protein
LICCFPADDSFGYPSTALTRTYETQHTPILLAAVLLIGIPSCTTDGESEFKLRPAEEQVPVPYENWNWLPKNS